MDQLVLSVGTYLARDSMRRSPSFWRDSLFGLIPMPIVWNLITVALVALIFWWLLRGSQKQAQTPMELLKRRYVAGEIDRKTFQQMKEDISD
jgi:uncharacterized membrane protein